MGTVIDFAQHDHIDRHQLWDRFERADLFEPYLDLQTQGVSQRQAAKQLQVPRTTLQAWQSWHDTLDICPHVAQFFQSAPGLAFLHRLVLAFHLICVEVGACGIRLVCLLLDLTGLDRFVAASTEAFSDSLLAACSLHLAVMPKSSRWLMRPLTPAPHMCQAAVREPRGRIGRIFARKAIGSQIMFRG